MANLSGQCFKFCIQLPFNAGCTKLHYEFYTLVKPGFELRFSVLKNKGHKVTNLLKTSSWYILFQSLKQIFWRQMRATFNSQ